jgi:hypothetical protein
MQIHNKIATDLSSILAKKFDKLTIANEQAQSTIEPDAGRIFTLEYTGSGKSYGSVTVNIVDPDALVVYYNNNITEDMRYDDKKDWYTFLKELRYFAKRNLMGFDVRNIGKQQLDKKDYAYIKTNDTSDTVEDVTESKLHGSLKTSYQNIGEVRLVIKHSKPVDEEKRGSRTRQIHSLFIENTAKERTKFPFRFLAGARAMAQHVNQGGAQIDELGQHIHEMNQEVIDLKKFVKAFRRADNFAEQDEAQSIIEQAKERATGLVATLKTLSGPKGYKSYVEQYEPTESTIEQADLDNIRSKLIRIERDNIVDSVLPSLAQGIKAMNEKQIEDTVAEAEQAVSQADKDYDDFEKEQDAKIANRASDLIKFAKSPDDIEVQNNPGAQAELNAELEIVKSSGQEKDQKNRSIVMKIIDYLELNAVDSELANALGNLDTDNAKQYNAAMGLALKYLKGNVKMSEPKAKKKLKTEDEQLESWANNLIEGTWAIPDTAEAIEALEKLMQNPLPVGPDAQNASNALGGIVGDDELYDDLGELSDEDPNADSRKIIQRWVLANIQRYDIDEQLIKRAMVAVDYDDGSVSEDDTDYPQVQQRNIDKNNVIEILKKHPVETKKMQMSNDLMSVYDTDLYMDLFDYYSEDMPYGTVHATDGDPVQYISDELDELGLMDEKVVEVDENLEQSLKKAEADLQSQKDAIGDKELETMLKIAGLIKDKLPKKEDTVDEDINEELDRASVTLDMVKPALEKLLMSYKADQKEYYDGEAEAKAELKAKGMSDEEVERELMQGDPYDYSYIMIDDIEDSIEALEDIMKNADADGDDIAELGNRGPQDTSASEKFMQDIKYAIKGDYPELFGKLFMYDIGESEVEESVTQDLDEACSLKCKECGDMLGEPTTDCQHDSQDPKGENWIMVDLDGDGDDDLAVKNEDINYQSEIDRILGLAGLK